MESKENYGDYASYLPNREEAAQTNPQPPAAEAQPQPQPSASESAQQVPVKEKIDGAINETAGKLRNLAQKLEGYGGTSNRQVDEVTGKVAGQLQRGAEYLESTSVDEMTRQLKETIRTQPLASIGIAFGVGFLFARLLRR